MKRVTVVIDFHGGSRLLGVLTDKNKIRGLKNLVKEHKQENYIKFMEIELNKIDPELIKRYSSATQINERSHKSSEEIDNLQDYVNQIEKLVNNKKKKT